MKMPLTELRSLIERYKKNKDDTPIALNDGNARSFALQELASICSSDIYAFIFFDEHGESELYDALADERTSRLISNQLNNSKLHILTNDTAKVKTLNFVSRHLDESFQNLRLHAIPKKLAEKCTEKTVDSEFFLATPEHLAFIGKYDGKGERLAEVSAFLNFFDPDFFSALKRFFENTQERADSGEFR
ncbi:hypothetical protein [Vibrio cholerae]|uniref:hypothetical protein n=1 Tax=Vibrio cholerae TaxID=666 RepID=UPI00155E0662|nr:hypothetical protein [Vibrio cholerae]EGQ8673263.1 hypothetical protein [Vibrio cholerae]EGR2320802.1 hypothetical protein [Vibrio cholerae]EGR2398225.1 hypothetical protein [Vibrio cholerae]EGR2401960.1 hypothetical protein [Vibrio cholerae]EGR4181178.1 hypothetical protein [Vibrio cholerae]